MLAIRLEGAEGDVTRGGESLLWNRRRSTPYVPSPLLYDGSLYFLHHYQPILSRLEAESGEEEGPYRLAGIRNLYASPIGAAGRLYLPDLAGATLVLSHANPPETLALNQLDDVFNASPVAVGGELFLRGERFLYCIAKD